MNVEIKVKHKDIGFRYEKIKSLLEKFEKLENKKGPIDQFRIDLNEIKATEFHVLSNALIWRLMLNYIDLPCKKKEVKYSNTIKPLLEERHFFDRLTGRESKNISTNVPFHFETFAPFRHREDSEGKLSVTDVYEKATKAVFDKNNALHSEIKTTILEILSNTFDHSDSASEAGIICVKSGEAEFKSKGMLSVCAVDRGQGIKSSFLSNPVLSKQYLKMKNEEIVAKATNFRVSCNPESSRHPKYKTKNGGIGLYFLKKFVTMHKDGHLVILSNKGYYYTDSSGREVKKNLETVSWPGTLVYFRINLDQDINPEYIDIAQHT